MNRFCVLRGKVEHEIVETTRLQCFTWKIAIDRIRVCMCVCIGACVCMYDAGEALLNWHGLALEHLTTCHLRSVKEDLTTIRGFTLHLAAVFFNCRSSTSI